jgi:FeS assembly SUF system regulator
MFKLSKKADYGLIALKHLAALEDGEVASAADIARGYGISAPLMAKVLQRLARSGLVDARHGSSGGYALARDPGEITALDVIRSIDGPLSITSCVTHRGECEQTSLCTVREPLRRVNDSIIEMLARMTILELARPAGAGAMVELET